MMPHKILHLGSCVFTQIKSLPSQVLNSTQHLIPHFSPYEIVACLHSLAKCGIVPPMTWLTDVNARAFKLVRWCGSFDVALIADLFVSHKAAKCGGFHPFS